MENFMSCSGSENLVTTLVHHRITMHIDAVHATLYKQVEQLRLRAVIGGSLLILATVAAAAGAVLQRREVEVRHGLVRLRGAVVVRGLRRLAPVPAHVAAERLAHGELEPADGALVHPRPVPLGGRRAASRARRRVAEHPRLQPRVAGPVPAERLERREALAARLALEHALRRHGPPARGRRRRRPAVAAARRRLRRRRQREQRHGVRPEALHLLALLRFVPRERHGDRSDLIDRQTKPTFINFPQASFFFSLPTS